MAFEDHPFWQESSTTTRATGSRRRLWLVRRAKITVWKLPTASLRHFRQGPPAWSQLRSEASASLRTSTGKTKQKIRIQSCHCWAVGGTSQRVRV